MTGYDTFQYHFGSHDNSRIGDDWVRLSDNDFHDLPKRLESLIALADAAGVWARDFLRIAKAAYLADRRSLRSATRDGWTRTIRLSVQINEPERWTEGARADLADLLGMLTGDQWEIRLCGGALTQDTLFDVRWATEVALFSGGLDSTAYAAHLAQRLRESQHAVFIAYDWNLQTPQQQVFGEIRKIARNAAPNSRVELSQTRLNPKAHGKKLDVTNRSRSLLFITTAVCIATVHRVSRVAVPENGQLALNPALTPGRPSACSTRSVHPWTLYLINRIIKNTGGDVTVHNPFLGLTKGEVCNIGINAGLDVETLQRGTISCSHSTSARAGGSPYYHCGHCFPCLVRRAGLHAVLDGQPDRSGYRFDLADLDSVNRVDHRTADLRDLRYWLTREFTLYDLIADAPLPPRIKPIALMPVIQKGRQELTEMITALAPARSSLG